MTGGDNWWSFVLTLLVILGMFGVWLGTTGVWLWRHGSEYGLATGGGVAVVIILV
jgi:palmitoyltransferase ZDHHC9/14/18